MRARARPVSSRVIMGRVNEAVLPVPVWAMPKTSRPVRALGIAAACIGVGVEYPAASIAARTFGLSPSSAKVLVAKLWCLHVDLAGCPSFFGWQSVSTFAFSKGNQNGAQGGVA